MRKFKEDVKKHKDGVSPEKAVAYIPRMAKGALVNLSGAGLRSTFMYAYTLLLARVLSASDLGLYFLIFTIINILSLVATVGLDTGIVRYVAIYYGEARYRVIHKIVLAAGVIGLVTGFSILVAVLFSASAINNLLFDDDSTALTGLKIFAISIPFWVIGKTFNATTQGLHKMQYQVLSRDVGEQITKISLSVLAAILGAGLIGIIWANVVAVMVAAAASVIFALVIIPGGSPKAKDEVDHPVKRMVLYSWPFAISNIFGIVLVWADLLLVGYFSGPADAGFYGAAIRVSALSPIILLAFATVLTPVVSDLYNRRYLSKLAVIYKTITRWTLIFSLPIMILLIVLAKPVMMIYGSEFVIASIVLSVLAISQFLHSVLSPAGIMVSMSGRSRLELFNVLVTLGINIVLCVLLIPKYGINGAAVANLASAIIINLMRNLEAIILVRVHAFSRGLVKPVVAGSLGTFTLILMAQFFKIENNLKYSFVMLTGFIFIYIVTMLIFGLDVQDKELMQLIKGRLTGTMKRRVFH